MQKSKKCFATSKKVNATNKKLVRKYGSENNLSERTHQKNCNGGECCKI